MKVRIWGRRGKSSGPEGKGPVAFGPGKVGSRAERMRSGEEGVTRGETWGGGNIALVRMGRRGMLPPNSSFSKEAPGCQARNGAGVWAQGLV